MCECVNFARRSGDDFINISGARGLQAQLHLSRLLHYAFGADDDDHDDYYYHISSIIPTPASIFISSGRAN